MRNKCCKLLAKNKLTIAFVESASAGYLAHRFSLCGDSGNVLKGGLVCYDISLKENLLKISHKLIKKYTAESMQVTHAMIAPTKKLIEADIYIACTGLLTKGGSETKEKPVGTFFYCIDFQGKIYEFRTLSKGTPRQKLKSLNRQICKSLIELIAKNK